MKWLMIAIVLVAATAQAENEIYRWLDARGTTHYTNREDEIPARYRGRAVVLNLGLPIAPLPGAAPVELPAAHVGAPIPGQQPMPPPPAAAGRNLQIQAQPRATTPVRPRRERALKEE